MRRVFADSGPALAGIEMDEGDLNETYRIMNHLDRVNLERMFTVMGE